MDGTGGLDEREADPAHAGPAGPEPRPGQGPGPEVLAAPQPTADATALTGADAGGQLDDRSPGVGAGGPDAGEPSAGGTSAGGTSPGGGPDALERRPVVVRSFTPAPDRLPPTPACTTSRAPLSPTPLSPTPLSPAPLSPAPLSPAPLSPTPTALTPPPLAAPPPPSSEPAPPVPVVDQPLAVAPIKAERGSTAHTDEVGAVAGRRARRAHRPPPVHRARNIGILALAIVGAACVVAALAALAVRHRGSSTTGGVKVADGYLAAWSRRDVGARAS